MLFSLFCKYCGPQQLDGLVGLEIGGSHPGGTSVSILRRGRGSVIGKVRWLQTSCSARDLVPFIRKLLGRFCRRYKLPHVNLWVPEADVRWITVVQSTNVVERRVRGLNPYNQLRSATEKRRLSSVDRRY